MSEGGLLLECIEFARTAVTFNFVALAFGGDEARVNRVVSFIGRGTRAVKIHRSLLSWGGDAALEAQATCIRAVADLAECAAFVEVFDVGRQLVELKPIILSLTQALIAAHDSTHVLVFGMGPTARLLWISGAFARSASTFARQLTGILADRSGELEDLLARFEAAETLIQRGFVRPISLSPVQA